MKKFYLTSAIPYVNAAPHIGHAQEFVYSDVIRRYQEILGTEVFYLCGADENALKIFQAAEKANQTPNVFTDLHNREFLELAKNLNVQFDVWQRGSDRQKHFPSSNKLWELCKKNGDIYKKSYTGLYCIGCETFYTKDELNPDGECFEHPGKKLDTVSEENYFFRLSKYQKFLEESVTSDQLKIVPQIRKNEALAFIKKGLPDFSISRSRERARGWGISVPDDPSHIMYVWFDALNIYQTGIGFGWNDKLYTKWWPQNVMVIGKGIIRFHAVYFPAILKSAGLKIPKQLFVHGYLTVDGQKMSKTLGNVVDPNIIINKYGVDPLRYYLLKEIPSYGDGDFSENRFMEVYNADLANGLGNTIARVARLAENSGMEFKIIKIDEIYREVQHRLIEEFRFNDALKNIWKTDLQIIDMLLDQKKPWIEKDKSKLKSILQKAIDAIRILAFKLKPFIPETAESISKQFESKKIKSVPPLFPRIK